MDKVLSIARLTGYNVKKEKTNLQSTKQKAHLRIPQVADVMLGHLKRPRSTPQLNPVATPHVELPPIGPGRVTFQTQINPATVSPIVRFRGRPSTRPSCCHSPAVAHYHGPRLDLLELPLDAWVASQFLGRATSKTWPAHVFYYDENQENLAGSSALAASSRRPDSGSPLSQSCGQILSRRTAPGPSVLP
jgi:hypothetical protein